MRFGAVLPLGVRGCGKGKNVGHGRGGDATIMRSNTDVDLPPTVRRRPCSNTPASTCLHHSNVAISLTPLHLFEINLLLQYMSIFLQHSDIDPSSTLRRRPSTNTKAPTFFHFLQLSPSIKRNRNAPKNLPLYLMKSCILTY